jgi:hypothetical protein
LQRKFLSSTTAPPSTSSGRWKGQWTFSAKTSRLGSEREIEVIFSPCASNWRGIGVCLPPMLSVARCSLNEPLRGTLCFILFYFIYASPSSRAGTRGCNIWPRGSLRTSAASCRHWMRSAAHTLRQVASDVSLSSTSVCVVETF